jgi:hypothetical protein
LVFEDFNKGAVDDEQEVELDDEHDMVELNVLFICLSVPFVDASIGLTLKPSSFFTIAGVMHKFENDVVSIDIFPKFYFLFLLRVSLI